MQLLGLRVLGWHRAASSPLRPNQQQGAADHGTQAGLAL